VRSRKLPLLAAAAVVLAGGAAALFVLRPAGGPSPAVRLRDPNVILVTLDTTRADGLSCYGNTNVRTPTVDAFAARGVRFERCYTQTPLTLPAHTTLMSGTLPLFHGVRDNGGFFVPQKLPTMAGLFKEKGYETGAFVGAWVLDSKWGLNRGFDTYFDDFDLSRFQTISFDTVRRPANEVLDAALPWLEARKDKRFFAWIHLYDPHSPYQLPPPFDREYAGRPYLGAIAFADAQLGRLHRFLESNGLLRTTVVIIAGDHGESLGEHGEATHGFFIYQSVLRVPLIIAAPLPKLRGRVCSEAVGLVDVLPTVCELVGLNVPNDVQSRSLVPALSGGRRGGQGLVYSETYYPRFHYGWSDLKGVQDGRTKLILAPTPELYDVAADPGETRNLVYERKKVYEDMRAAAESLIAGAGRNAFASGPTKVDAATRERLAALGYVGSFTDPGKTVGRPGADPKDKIAVYNGLARAREAGLAGRPDEAIRIVRDILAADPEATAAAYDILGASDMAKNDLAGAAENFRKALGLDPELMNAHYRLGWIAEKQGRLGDAEAEYLKEIDIMPGHFKALYNLARVYHATGRPDKERGTLEKCLEADPKFALTYFYIARLDLERGEGYEKGIELARKGVDLRPAPAELALGYSLLAALYKRTGDEARARECAEKARALSGGADRR